MHWTYNILSTHITITIHILYNTLTHTLTHKHPKYTTHNVYIVDSQNLFLQCGDIYLN